MLPYSFGQSAVQVFCKYNGTAPSLENKISLCLWSFFSFSDMNGGREFENELFLKLSGIVVSFLRFSVKHLSLRNSIPKCAVSFAFLF